MMPPNRFRLLVTPLLAYALLFPVLSLDTVARLISNFATQDKGNLLLLVYYELSRSVRTTLGLILIGLLLAKSVDRREARALVVFLLFGVIAYSMGFSGGGYVGPFQQWLTFALVDAGFTRWHLRLAFGFPLWPLWLAIPPLIQFSLLFPRPLDPATVIRAGEEDRAGLMRGVPGAGVDVGAGMRRFLARALQRGWLDSYHLWTAGIVGSLLSISLRHSGLRLLLWGPLLIGVGIAVTALRVGYINSTAEQRRRLRWLGRAAFAAFVLAALAGIISISESEAAAIAGFVLMTLAPGVLLLGIGFAVLSVRESA